MKNNFEHIIKNALENHEAPYEVGAWEKFQANLAPAIPFYKTKWFIGSVIGLLLIGGATAYIATIDNSISSGIVADNNNQLTTGTKDSKNNTNSITSDEATDIINEEKTIEPSDDVSNDIDRNINNENTGWTVRPPSASDETAGGNNNENIENNNGITSPTLNPEVPVIDKTNEGEINYKTDFSLAKKICEGSEIILLADNYNSAYNYDWNIGDIKFKGEKVALELEGNDILNITLTVTNNKGEELDKVEKFIEVLESPENAVEITENQNSIVNEHLFVSTDDRNSVTWNFDDGETSKESTAKHSYKTRGSYDCSYVLTSHNGCSKTYTKKIAVEGYYSFRSTYGFSPDGNNLNDFFIPGELKLINRPFVMTIHSRSGQQLYYTNSIDQPWDGKMPDGTKSPFGAYVWRVTLTNEFGVEDTYQGTVTNVSN